MLIAELHGRLRVALLALLVFAAVPAAAASTGDEALPHAIVQLVTDELVAAIDDARPYYDDEPERFYGEIDAIIAPHVDYRRIARAVMGKYGSNKYYRQLQTEEERQLFVDRVNIFADVLQSRMSQTLAKGLMAFSGGRIDVLPPGQEDLQRLRQGKSVSVTQHIYRDSGEPMRVQFKLVQDRAGDWRVINVVLDSVNLGKQYRNEFASKLREFGGDLDQVIAYWGAARHDAQLTEESVAPGPKLRG